MLIEPDIANKPEAINAALFLNIRQPINKPTLKTQSMINSPFHVILSILVREESLL